MGGKGCEIFQTPEPTKPGRTFELDILGSTLPLFSNRSIPEQGQKGPQLRFLEVIQCVEDVHGCSYKGYFHPSGKQEGQSTETVADRAKLPLPIAQKNGNCAVGLTLPETNLSMPRAKLRNTSS
jgi:hypothetical protein